MRPEEIELASMAIIEREMGTYAGPVVNLPVIKRVIHTTADFDFMDNLKFSPGAVEAGCAALRAGKTVVTDTNMAASGISKPVSARYKVSVVCRMADEDIKKEALERGVTRAVVSIEHAAARTPDAIFAIGNAPTALMRLCELVKDGKAKPSLIIGVPVGFVNVVESKEILAAMEVPYIAAMGRKGGSPVATAIVNALLYSLSEDR